LHWEAETATNRRRRRTGRRLDSMAGGGGLAVLVVQGRLSYGTRLSALAI
jgi:hypothetical protein